LGIVLVLDIKGHAQSRGVTVDIVFGYGPKEPGLGQFIDRHGQRFGNIQEIDGILGKATEEKIAHSGSDQKDGGEVDPFLIFCGTHAISGFIVDRLLSRTGAICHDTMRAWHARAYPQPDQFRQHFRPTNFAPQARRQPWTRSDPFPFLTSQRLPIKKAHLRQGQI